MEHSLLSSLSWSSLLRWSWSSASFYTRRKVSRRLQLFFVRFIWCYAIQGWFYASAQPMRDVVLKNRCISLATRKPRFSPTIYQYSMNDRVSAIWHQIFETFSQLSSYPAYFREPHWFPMGLPEISSVTFKDLYQVKRNTSSLRSTAK